MFLCLVHLNMAKWCSSRFILLSAPVKCAGARELVRESWRQRATRIIFFVTWWVVLLKSFKKTLCGDTQTEREREWANPRHHDARVSASPPVMLHWVIYLQKTRAARDTCHGLSRLSCLTDIGSSVRHLRGSGPLTGNNGTGVHPPVCAGAQCAPLARLSTCGQLALYGKTGALMCLLFCCTLYAWCNKDL